MCFLSHIMNLNVNSLFTHVLIRFRYFIRMSSCHFNAINLVLIWSNSIYIILLRFNLRVHHIPFFHFIMYLSYTNNMRVVYKDLDWNLIFVIVPVPEIQTSGFYKFSSTSIVNAFIWLLDLRYSDSLPVDVVKWFLSFGGIYAYENLTQIFRFSLL